MNAIIRSFFAAYKGKRFWKSIKREYRIQENDFLILAPDSDAELNRCAAAHLYDFLKRKYARRVVIITSDKDMIKALQNNAGLRNLQLDIVLSSLEQKIEDLCKYYCFVQFHRNITVVSLKDPFNNGRGLLNKKGFTIEMLVKYSILGE
jgi:hypothetical protein